MRFMRKNTKKVSILLAVALLGTAVAFLSSEAIGLPSYKNELPDGGENFDCAYCHEPSGETKTQFGEDFKSNGNAYDEALASLDSDGDGYTNEEEFSSDPVTNPGDMYSYPGADLPPPEDVQPDLVPWILTMIAGMVAIIDFSVIAVLVSIRKKRERRITDGGS